MAVSDLLLDRVVVAIGDQYLVERELGRGGSGVVYAGVDLRLHRPVAIKVLPPELAFQPAVRERFLREAQTAAQLAHPHIVPIYSVDEREGLVFFVMALITGETLASRMAREPRVPLAESRRILAEVADALDYAHRHGVVHRDVKPDNILLERESGRALVTDFGIARATTSDARLTATGLSMGTPAYMSPEQALGERELDARSDIYSLGVVGYQLLAGEPPFAAKSTPAMLMKHVSEQPRPLAERRPDAPRALVAAIERAMMKAPEDRWPSAAALRDALTTPEASATPLPARDEAHRSLGHELFDRPGAWQPESREERRERLRHEVNLERIASRRERKLAREDERSFDTWPLWHRVTAFRRKIFSAMVALPVLFVINASMGGFPWVFIVAAVMGVDILRKGVSIWSDGVSPLDAFRKGARARVEALERERVLGLPPAAGSRPWAATDATAPAAAHPPLVTDAVLRSAYGGAVRRAIADGAAIRELVGRLGASERAMVPEVGPTVDALLDRVARLATTLHQLDADLGAHSLASLDERVESVRNEPPGAARERRLELLERQRATLTELSERRGMLLSQLESAGLALGNLKLDLLKLRSSGLDAALHDVTSATQQARAVSREIGYALDAAKDVEGL